MNRLIFAVCILLVSVSCVGETGGGDDVINHVNAGDEVPGFTVYPPDGAEWDAFVSPDGFIDRRSLLVLFDPMCGQCKELLPVIESVWIELVRDNSEEYCLVNISRQRTAESAQLWKDEEFEMPYHLDPDRSVFELFANSTVPRVYLIGADGKVREMFVEKSNFTAGELIDKLKNLK